MTEREHQLWTRYLRSRSIPDRNALVEHYYPDLERIVRGRPPVVRASGRMGQRRRERPVSNDDVSEAAVSLVEAVEQYQPSVTGHPQVGLYPMGADVDSRLK